jgi:hypothetical protein
VAAFMVGAVDQYTAHAPFTHLGERDLVGAGKFGHPSIEARDMAQGKPRIVSAASWRVRLAWPWQSRQRGAQGDLVTARVRAAIAGRPNCQPVSERRKRLPLTRRCPTERSQNRLALAKTPFGAPVKQLAHMSQLKRELAWTAKSAGCPFAAPKGTIRIFALGGFFVLACSSLWICEQQVAVGSRRFSKLKLWITPWTQVVCRAVLRF